MALQVVILAAGQGKRMHSHLPKILHKLAGKPLITHVLDTVATLHPTQTPIVIYGHQGDRLRHALDHFDVRWVEQKQQLGTGHALLQALPLFNDEDNILILYGDVPLISKTTIDLLMNKESVGALNLLTIELLNSTGYGRIKRQANGSILQVIEEKDATPDERSIREINTGIYYVQASHLKKWLPLIQPKNAQQEYYLTDIVSLAVTDQLTVRACSPALKEEVLGVNDCMQLAHLERFYQRQQADKLMQQGVTIVDPARFDVRGEVKIGKDVVIDINVILEGRVVIGDGCVIGANSIIRNTTLANEVEVKENCVIDGAEIGEHCMIGPFARLRPGAVLASQVHIGNFVEIKNSEIDKKSKVNHLSYIGDSELGERVNVGAGTITCNYDGVNKYKTIIGSDAFIGSCSQLIAPVKIGEGATIGAGSTISKDAPAHQLTLSRAPQCTVKDWSRAKKV